MLPKHLALISLAIALTIPAIAESAPRQVYFRGAVSGHSQWMRERDGVFGVAGDRIILDQKIGGVFFVAPSSVDFPILRAERGGAQTLLRVRIGRVTARVRRFTSPYSFFSIVSYDKLASVASRGTEFSVMALSEKSLITGVYESSVIATSGGVSVKVGTGEAALMESGKPPVVFPMDFVLSVEHQRFQQRNGSTNVVTGKLAKGNTVEVDEGTVEQMGNCFRIITRGDSFRVVNPGGTKRSHPINGVKPFFGS
ncbi:MAG: hypothetical protein ACRC62_37495 [Microcoleus sp.]